MTLSLAAAREVEEETGLTGEILPDVVALSRHRAPCRPGIVDWHLDVQHALVVADPPEPGPLAYLSPESLQVAWWPVDALPAAVAPGVVDAVPGRGAAVPVGRRPQEAGLDLRLTRPVGGRPRSGGSRSDSVSGGPPR